ncbi:RNA polymerase sigma-70 factor, partial [Pedobacter sp. HMWF019]|uniref:RNA polymerase sigma factor n=1 Tax=Pedobacter sp. HMWF019 TaxID=2056856 RepID=UPI000D4F0C0F
MSSYQTFTDVELADLFKTGDRTAFTVIYQRYWKKIFIIACKRIGDAHVAEEIVQEIFLNFWRKRHSFVITTGFQNYFAIAVKFEILDLMRKKANADAYEKEMASSFSEADDSTLRDIDLME